MKKLVVDCSKPHGQQETEVDMEPQEIVAMNAQYQRFADIRASKPPSLEDKVAELTARLEAVENTKLEKAVNPLE